MALINHVKREVNAKIVYFGMPYAGKGTSLGYLHGRIKPALCSGLNKLPAGGDTLLYFDFSPFEHPVLDGYRIRFHIYTLSGKVANPGAWKMTLKGADGVVAVLDMSSGESGIRQSIDSLKDYLNTYGVALAELPLVCQLNKSDMESSCVNPEEVLSGSTSRRSVATGGEGVLEAFSLISRQVMERITSELSQRGAEVETPDDMALIQDEAVVLTPDAAGSAGEPEPPAGELASVGAGSESGQAPPPAVRVAWESSAVERVLRIPVELTIAGKRCSLTLAISVENLEEVADVA